MERSVKVKRYKKFRDWIPKKSWGLSCPAWTVAITVAVSVVVTALIWRWNRSLVRQLGWNILIAIGLV